MSWNGLKPLVIIAGVVSLAACGEDEKITISSGGEVGLLPGVYAAEIVRGEGVHEAEPALLAFISPTGAMSIVEGPLGLSLANIEFDNEGNVSGSAVTVRFRESVNQWLSFESVVGGVYSSREKAVITTTSGSNTNGATETYSFVRDNDISNNGATLSQISTIYSSEDNSVVVTIAANGDVIASDEDGCTFDGKLEIPDSSTNVFEISYIASNCKESEQNGEFFGLGGFDLDQGGIIFGATNGEIATVFQGRR